MNASWVCEALLATELFWRKFLSDSFIECFVLHSITREIREGLIMTTCDAV